MRRLLGNCCGLGVVLAMVALVAWPAIASEQPQKDVSVSGELRAQGAKPVSTDVTSAKTATRSDSIQPAAGEARAQRRGATLRAGELQSISLPSDMSAIRETAQPVARPRGGDAGQRDLGAGDILLYKVFGDGWLYFTGENINDNGDEVYLDKTQFANQAYAIDKVWFNFFRIVKAGEPDLHTWARLTFWKLDLPDECPPSVPVHDPLLGEVIVDCGTDTKANGTCDDGAGDDWDAWEVDLTTGNALSHFDSETFSNVIVSNKLGPTGEPNPLGSIPAGYGDIDDPLFVGIEIGKDDGAGNFVEEPDPDLCLAVLGITTGPAGYTFLDYISGAPGDFPSGFYEIEEGITPNLVLIDAIGDADGEWDCDEAVWAGDSAFVSASLQLDGSRAVDCDSNGIVDALQVIGWPESDDGSLAGSVAGNGVPDECDIFDCDENGLPDVCDLNCEPGSDCDAQFGSDPACGASSDCNSDGVPDQCQADCNENGIPDDCDITSGFSQDCQPNGVPDECDVDDTDPDGDGEYWFDCDENDVPDGCERFINDCNQNGKDDYCDVLNGIDGDSDGDGILDTCEGWGVTTNLDFEAKGDVDYEYVAGPVNEQPFEQDAGVGSRLVLGAAAIPVDWQTMSFASGSFEEVTIANRADVVAGSVPNASCAGSEYKLVMQEPQAGDSVPEFAADSPNILLADPNWTGIYGWYTPVVQTLSFDVVLSAGAQRVDWDLWIGSHWDDSGFVNPYRVVLSFATDDDGTTEILVFADGSTATDVAWTPGQTHHVEIVLDYAAAGNTIDFLTDAGKVYLDGNLIATFTPNLEGGDTLLMDKMYIDTFVNGYGTYGGGTFTIDCIELDVSDQPNPFVPDCDGNAVDDRVELAEGAADCNNNAVLDVCEALADCEADCNVNFVLDECEIAEGLLEDVDGNNIADVCQPEIAYADSNGFEAADGFTAGEDIGGQQGWTHVDSDPPGDLLVTDAGPAGWGNSVLMDPGAPPLGFYGFAQPLLIEQPENPGVEEFSFRIFIESADYAGEALYADVTDWCQEGGIVDGSEIEAIPSAGLIFAQEDNKEIQTWKYTDDGESVFVEALDTGYTWAADTEIWPEVRVLHARGQVELRITENNRTYLTLGPDGGSPLQYGLNTRHMAFSSDVPTSKKFIDQVNYRSGPDCDFDGEIDEFAIAAGLVEDLNADMIPDRCQDCNNNGVLDPDEILGGAADCNGNDVLDSCEVDNVTSNGWFTAVVDPGGFNYSCDDAVENGFEPLPPECFVTRYGCDVVDELGEPLCDCDGNDIPDTCEGTLIEGVDYSLGDCNENGVVDRCDIHAGVLTDADDDGFPDECVTPLGCNLQDLDLDGDVDLGDFRILQDCIAEPAGTAAPGCECADLNNDDAIDVTDYDAFWYALIGPVL